MSVEVFIDSNVLLYQLDNRDSRKHAIAEQVIRGALERGDACISFQVVQECLNTVLHKAQLRLDADGARAWFDTVLEPLFRVQPSPALYRRGIGLMARWQFSFYDALIVAGALESGCTTLLTEDLQEGQVVEGLRIVNPFRT